MFFHTLNNPRHGLIVAAVVYYVKPSRKICVEFYIPHVSVSGPIILIIFVITAYTVHYIHKVIGSSQTYVTGALYG